MKTAAFNVILVVVLLCQSGCGDGSAPSKTLKTSAKLPAKQAASRSSENDPVTEKASTEKVAETATKEEPSPLDPIDSATQLSELGVALDRDGEDRVVAVVLPNGVENLPIDQSAAFPNLRHLHLDHAKIDAKDVVHLAGLRVLERLSLNGTSLGDAAMRQIAKLPELKRLDMSWTLVTDAGAAELIRCNRLEVLDLSWASVGDDSLEHFKNMPSLRRVILEGTNVSATGVDELRNSRPDLTVEF